MTPSKLATRRSALGTVVLLFVLSATSGALAGATVSYVMPPRTVTIPPPTNATSTTPIVHVTSTQSEPSLISVEPHLAQPLVPPGFLTRRSSPVASLYRKAHGTTIDDRTLTDDRLLGQAVTLTSDGWFVTSAAVLGTQPIAELTLWHDGVSYVVTKGLLDRVNGTAYLKVSAHDLTAPAFGNIDSLAPGSEAWTERRASSFAPVIITSLTEGMGPDSVSSEITARRLALTGNGLAGDDGSPVWDDRGSLLGIVESVPGKPLTAVPASSISASFSSLLATGFIRHATLGVRTTDLSVLRIDGDRGTLPLRGALIRDDRKTGKVGVIKDSAAAKAGLRTGDVILAVERDMLDGTHDLGEVLADYRPETDLTIRVLRAGQELQLSARIGTSVTGEPLK